MSSIEQETGKSPLWHGRFASGPSEKALAFETSIHIDSRMAADDIAGSVAHAGMLGKCGIITGEDADKIVSSLKKIASELEEWVNVKEGDCENSDVQNHQLARLCANYLTTDVLGALAGKSFCEKEFPVSPENFAEFICLIYKGEITSKIAKQVLAEMMKTGNDPSAIITQKGLSQIRDEKQIAAMIDEVLVKNQKAATDYRAGKQNAFQFLVGQTLTAAQGRANPDLLKKILLEKLAEVRE